MMYNNKLVACIKVGGKILREFNETVYVPFGSEYSLFLSNKDTRRVRVEISIDGRDVFPGSALIIGPKQSVDLERFVENHEKGHRFKFIERTSKIEDHRGIGADDGLIRISYKFEKEQPLWSPKPYWYNNDILRKTSFSNNFVKGGTIGQSPFTMNCNTTGSLGNSVMDSAESEFFATASLSPEIENDAGITVNGSISNQQFQTVAGFIAESVEHVMIFKLLGETASNKPVVKPIDVKTSQICPTCGRKNKIHAKFCSECGTNLEVIHA